MAIHPLKDDIKHIIGSAMLFDERHRFDDWRGDEAKEWVEQIADAIIGLLTPAASDSDYYLRELASNPRVPHL